MDDLREVSPAQDARNRVKEELDVVLAAWRLVAARAQAVTTVVSIVLTLTGFAFATRTDLSSTIQDSDAVVLAVLAAGAFALALTVSIAAAWPPTISTLDPSGLRDLFEDPDVYGAESMADYQPVLKHFDLIAVERVSDLQGGLRMRAWAVRISLVLLIIGLALAAILVALIAAD